MLFIGKILIVMGFSRVQSEIQSNLFSGARHPFIISGTKADLVIAWLCGSERKLSLSHKLFRLDHDFFRILNSNLETGYTRIQVGVCAQNNLENKELIRRLFYFKYVKKNMKVFGECRLRIYWSWVSSFFFSFEKEWEKCYLISGKILIETFLVHFVELEIDSLRKAEGSNYKEKGKVWSGHYGFLYRVNFYFIKSISLHVSIFMREIRIYIVSYCFLCIFFFLFEETF